MQSSKAQLVQHLAAELASENE